MSSIPARQAFCENYIGLQTQSILIPTEKLPATLLIEIHVGHNLVNDSTRMFDLLLGYGYYFVYSVHQNFSVKSPLILSKGKQIADFATKGKFPSI